VVPNFEQPRLVQNFITRSSHRRKIKTVRISYFSRKDELGLVDLALVEYQPGDLTVHGSESRWCEFFDDNNDTNSW
jgi:hypothetical protein